jgi:hypothetical protein
MLEFRKKNIYFRKCLFHQIYGKQLAHEVGKVRRMRNPSRMGILFQVRLSKNPRCLATVLELVRLSTATIDSRSCAAGNPKLYIRES